jgi:hypothetical protein
MNPMKLTLTEAHSFSSGTRWIWAADAATGPGDAWWIFRRTLTLPADCREARVRITAAFHYLRPGAENVIAILAPTHKAPSRRGVVAELRWHSAAGWSRPTARSTRAGGVRPTDNWKSNAPPRPSAGGWRWCDFVTSWLRDARRRSDGVTGDGVTE